MLSNKTISIIRVCMKTTLAITKGNAEGTEKARSDIQNALNEFEEYINIESKLSISNLIETIANEIASLECEADKSFYWEEDFDSAEFKVNQAESLIDLSEKLKIKDKVLKEALKIYDFSNSGKVGYELNKEGIITKIF